MLDHILGILTSSALFLGTFVLYVGGAVLLVYLGRRLFGKGRSTQSPPSPAQGGDG